jgi:hypothetical protein
MTASPCNVCLQLFMKLGIVTWTILRIARSTLTWWLWVVERDKSWREAYIDTWPKNNIYYVIPHTLLWEFLQILKMKFESRNTKVISSQHSTANNTLHSHRKSVKEINWWFLWTLMWADCILRENIVDSEVARWGLREILSRVLLYSFVWCAE